MELSKDQLTRYLDFAENVARIAGEITLKYFPTSQNQSLEVIRKEDHSPVTIADREAEEKIREHISREFPDHGILGEEFGTERQDADFVWIIDPIDGTKSFIRGVPLYGVLVALEYKKDVVAGVIHHPPLHETVKAGKGLGCFWNGNRTRVSQVEKLNEAMILCTNPSNFYEKDKKVFDNLLKKITLLRTWGDCYGYTLVATGRAEAMIDSKMAAWDCAAIKPIIEEAGGTFTSWKGEKTIYGGDSVGCNADLSQEILNILGQWSE